MKYSAPCRHDGRIEVCNLPVADIVAAIQDGEEFSVHGACVTCGNLVEREYGVGATLGVLRDRVTFVIDGQGIVRHVFTSKMARLALPQLDVKWVKVTPEDRIASVANGTVDIECGSTTKTLGRMAQVDFSVLTFLDGGSLLTLSAANINKLTDLSGKRVAVIPGTTTEGAVRGMVKKLGLQNVTLLSVKDHSEGVAALDDAKIDAYASDRTLLAGLAVSSRNPAKLYLIEDFISYEPYALMVRRGDPAFHLAVDRVLIRLYRSAEVVPIYEKWFGPFPESGSLIAAVYVLNSVPD
jgi:ABC-type amino acid transport substrate-binding protein